MKTVSPKPNFRTSGADAVTAVTAVTRCQSAATEERTLPLRTRRLLETTRCLRWWLHVHHRSIQASLGCSGGAATGGDHGSLDCRISRRRGGNDFVSRLHRGRSHPSGVIRAALIGRSQAGCLVLRGVRACAERPPPRLPHARRGIPAGLVDESRRDATLYAQVGLLRRVRSRISLASLRS